MTVGDYQKKARRTQAKDLTDEEKLRHAVLGLAAESGEVAGIFQKKYQGHPVDLGAVVEELGDCIWMISEICDTIGVPMEQVMEANIRKLEKRYPEGFEAERSLHRRESKT